MRQPKVSVIVPIYKVEQYLPQCIESIVNQTLKDIEIILLDDGSPDKCSDIIDKYAAADSRIIPVHKNNEGYGITCNRGFNLASGEYVAIVESDDFIELEMYEELYNYAKKLDADVVKTPFFDLFDTQNDKTSCRSDCSFRIYISSKTPMDKAFSVCDHPQIMSVHASVWSGIYKRSYLNEHNIRFIEANGAGYVDVQFRLDTMLNTNRIAWLDKPYYNYRTTSADSSTNKWNNMTMLTRWKEAHEKYCHGEMYNDSVGPQIFCDEYCNSLRRVYFSKFTASEYLQCWKNFRYVKTDYIMRAPLLTDEEKSDAIYFKKYPIQFVLKKRLKEKMSGIDTGKKEKVKRVLRKLGLWHK